MNIKNLSVSKKSIKELTTNRAIDFIKNNRALILFTIFIIVNIIVTPNFLQMGTLKNILVQTFPVLILALGMTLVITTKGIDVSVGSVMAIAASTSTILFNIGAPLVVCVLAGLSVAMLCGFFNGFMIARFGIQPIIITLILMIGGRGLAQIILGELTISFYGTSYAEMGTYSIANVIPIQVIIMAIIFIVIFFIIKGMTIGRYIEAVGDNSSAARLSGINVVTVIIIVYTICGLMAGIAGIMEGARINAVNAGRLGEMMELDAIAAVAVGGTSFSGGKAKIIGTVMGAFIVQMITISVNMNQISYNYSLLFKALIIILVLLLQRKGET